MLIIIIILFFSVKPYTYSINEMGLNDNIKFEKANVALNDIAYNGKSTYVAVGENGEIEVSKDGIHTELVKVSGVSSNLTKIKWTGAQFIAIGDKGTVLTSYDGYKWSRIKSISSEDIINLTYNKSCIVLVGDKGRLYAASKGLNFTLVKSNTTEFLNDIITTSFGFIAVGNHGAIITSKDGFKWNKVQSGISTNLMSVTWNGKMFIAVGGNVILTSSDSKKWTATSFNNIKTYNNLNLTKVAWNRKEIVAAGTGILSNIEYNYKEENAFIFFNSIDGVHWKCHIVRHYILEADMPFQQGGGVWYEPINVSLSDLIYVNGRFMLFGHDEAQSTPVDTGLDNDKTPMLIGYINESANSPKIENYPSLSKDVSDWDIDYFDSTTDKKPDKPMQKVLWDGKNIIVVGDTILKYNDSQGKSYIRKGEPEGQLESCTIFNGKRYINYQTSTYTEDKKYWIYNGEYTYSIKINNVDMIIDNQIIDDRVNLLTSGRIIWTGTVELTTAYRVKNFEKSILIYSYDGAHWYSTGLYGVNFELNKAKNGYSLTIDYKNYVSKDGVKWNQQNSDK